MRRGLVIVTGVAVIAVVGSVVLGAQAASPSGVGGRRAPDPRQFVGYWMGIDPLDGGDSRRGITRKGGRTFVVVGRDTVFTLCDDTDRAIITGDAVLVDQALGGNVVLTCFGNGSTVELRIRYEAVDRNILRETVSTPDGSPVDEILFHRVSER